uniref:DNA (cytosine-5-)-methyltransferase n=1 Tax=Solibacter usitatus (strain Ellin6076) TaxID=234267 RepID=Q027X8_SOLUE
MKERSGVKRPGLAHALSNGSDHESGRFTPRLFSFFSGLGFLDLGFEKAGYTVAFVNEFRASFLKAYKHARLHLKMNPPEYGYVQGDISDFLNGAGDRLSGQVRDSKLAGNLVGFVGGPPCPDFSVGGKNRGREGDNGKLSATYVELISKQKPDFFLFENVKGLWQTKAHRAFYEELKTKLHKARYVTTERLINTLDYAAPQDRARILLVGVQEGRLRDQKIAFDQKRMELEDGFFPWTRYARYANGSAFEFPWPETAPFRENSERKCPEGVPAELTVEHWFQQNDVLNHENSTHCFKPRAGLARFLSVDEGDDSKKSYKRLHRWRYSPTVCYGNNEVHLHPYKPRRISVAEALALQSLPKEFVLPPDMTLSDMFKGVGNGVPFVAARAVAMAFLDILRADESDSSRTDKSHRCAAKEQGIPVR